MLNTVSKNKINQPKETYGWKYPGNKFKSLVYLFLTIRPQVIIHIPLDVFSCNAKKVEKNSLDGMYTLGSPLHLLPGNQHSSPPGGTSGHMASDHIPSISKQRRIPQLGFGKKESIEEEELHHHTGLCCKPFFHKVRVVEGIIVPNDDIQSHARPQQSCRRVEPVFHSVHQEMR